MKVVVKFESDFERAYRKAFPGWDDNSAAKKVNTLWTQELCELLYKHASAEQSSEDVEKALAELHELLIKKHTNGERLRTPLPMIDVNAAVYNEPNDKWRTPLQIAAHYNIAWAIDPLLEAGAKIDYTRNSWLTSAFEAACCAGSFTVAEKLRSGGAKYDLGRLLNYAFITDDSELLARLMQWHPEKFTREKLNRYLFDCVDDLSPKCFEWCIEKGAKCNEEEHKSILLCIADIGTDYSKLGQKERDATAELLKLLLEQECSVNHVDTNGKTALGYLLEHKAYRLAHLLVQHPDCNMETGIPEISARHFSYAYDNVSFVPFHVMAIVDKAIEKGISYKPDGVEIEPYTFRKFFLLVDTAPAHEKPAAFEKMKTLVEKHKLNSLLGDPLSLPALEGQCPIPALQEGVLEKLFAEKPFTNNAIRKHTYYAVGRYQEDFAAIKQSLRTRLAKGEPAMQQYEFKALCTLDLFVPGTLAAFLEHPVFLNPREAKRISEFCSHCDDEWKEKHASLVQRFEERAKFSDAGKGSGWARGGAA